MSEPWRPRRTRPVNRHVEPRIITGGDGFQAKLALEPARSTVRIASARYELASRKVTPTLQHERTLSPTPGHYIEEAEEW